MVCNPNRMTSVEPLINNRLYGLDGLTELRRTMLRYARYFPPGPEPSAGRVNSMASA